MTPEISLIICTKNRAISLNRCLQSINQQEIIEASEELIIVNNGSTDNTDEILREFKNKSLFSLKIINEAKQGLGRARNAGILAAEGKIIAFTDDDCYPAAGYFKNVISAFATGEFYYCGGRILLYDKTDSTYGCNYSLTREIIAPYSFIPAGIIQGANMVIDRKLVDEIGVFDPMFGAGTSFRCEDIDYCAKASMSEDKFGGHYTYLLLTINCNYPLKGYGKNSKSGTGDATSYHSKRKQTVTNLFF